MGNDIRVDVDVAIINWNTAADAMEAARGFSASTGVCARVTLVDNNSKPEQQAMLAEQDGRGFELIQAGSNLGFGSAANLALAKGSGDYIVVSNADVMPAGDALAAMIAASRAHPDSGMVGPVFGSDADLYHDQLPGRATLLIRTMIGSFGRKTIKMPGPGETAQVEQPSGACFVMSRELWEQIGGFDEGFFLWYEDVDLAHRLRDLGRNGLIVGDAKVGHLGGESFAKLDNRRKQAIRLASLRRYVALHHRRTLVFAKPLLWLSGRIRARPTDST